ncbi:MAG: hypothetical protein Q9187_009549 [Circinaria calcarea]
MMCTLSSSLSSLWLSVFNCIPRPFRRQLGNAPREPPRSIEWLLAHRNTGRERSRLLTLKRAHRNDRPIDSLYRLYESIVEDWTTELRNEIEYFFNQHMWAVASIPDPCDPNPERYAILSVIPHLLVKAFNRNISLGLPRDAPAIIVDLDELKERPKILEEVPIWCKKVPPLQQTMTIPNVDDEYLPGKDDERASPEFLTKNILAWEPHIHFI